MVHEFVDGYCKYCDCFVSKAALNNGVCAKNPARITRVKLRDDALSSVEIAVLAGLLPMLTILGEHKTIERTQTVSLSRVLSKAWSPRRFERCLALLRAGEKAPAIHVSRFVLPDGAIFYVPSDGNHRAEARRHEGENRIAAHISCESLCRTDLAQIMPMSEGQPPALWIREERGLRLINDLTPDALAMARRMGIVERTA